MADTGSTDGASGKDSASGKDGVKSAGYRWYLAAQVLSLFGTMMSYIRYGGAAALAAIDAAQCLPMLLFSRRAGTIVARHRAVRVAMVTQGLEAAGALAIGVPLLAGWMTIWYLVPLSFVIGCVACVDLPARQTFMLDLVGPGDLRRGSSLFATVTGLARIAGPGVAGIIIAASGESAVFLADAASFLGVIAVLALWSGDARHAPVPDGLGGFGLQFSVTNPLMATRIFHLGAVGFGLLGTFVAVGGIAGNYYSSRRGDPGRSEFLVWALVFGIAECLAAVMPAAWAYDLAMIVIGGATQLFAVSATVYLQQATPAAQRGHALSAYNAGFMGFVPAGAFAVAGLAAVAGIRWALIGPGLLIAACAAGLLAVRLCSERPAAGPPGRSPQTSTVS